jgi:tape measure domain-containing protein
MSTTINNYSVGLSLNASDYIRNSALSRGETARLKKEIEGARTPAEVYANKLGLIDKALKEGAIEQGTYNRLLDSARQKFNSVGSSAAGYASSLKNIAAGYVSMHAVKSVIGDSIKLAAEAESAGIAFEVLTGSVQESQAMVAGLRELAAQTPLGVNDTQAAAKTMLSFGVASESILPTLKMLGDVTGGNSERFKMMALAYSQVAAAGRLMGQDLLQMVNAGFNPLQQISKTTGESLLQLKKRMEEGGISAQEVANALKAATSEGGQFFGMIDRMADTTEGKFNILKDSIDSIKRDLGEGLLPLMNDIADAASVWARQFKVGMDSLRSGNSYADIMNAEKAAMDAMAEQRKFAEEQIRRKRAGLETVRTDSSLAATQATADAERMAAVNRQISAGLEAGISSGIQSLKTGGGGILDAIRVIQDSGQMLASIGLAQTKELSTAIKDDPKISALEAGTQAAYDYLDGLTRDAERNSKLEAKRQTELAENAKSQRETMMRYLDAINKTLEANGFKRIR